LITRGGTNNFRGSPSSNFLALSRL
jgi:hypothetical protein